MIVAGTLAIAIGCPADALENANGTGACARTFSVTDEPSEATPSEALLSGVVIRRREYGPPGWGEDPAYDSKWYAWFLKLDREITLVTAAEAYTGKLGRVREVQLRGRQEHHSGYDEFLGRHVIARGSLYLPSAPTDVGNALLDTRSIVFGSTRVCGRKTKEI